MKKLLCLLLAVLVLAALTACGEMKPADSAPANTEEPSPAGTQDGGTAAEARAGSTMTAYNADGSAVTLEDCGDGTWKDENGAIYYPGEDGVLRARGSEDLYTDVPASEAANTPEPAAPIRRQEGERFEAVIEIEGMEETVQYEHIRNDTLGFEMDYDYESFVRQSESVCDRLVSVWDDPDAPENYLEMMYSAEDAETVAASVSGSLSGDYDLLRETRTLDRAGSCIYIEASVLKGTNNMADRLEAVYIIPADDGCRVATEHFSAESAEGFGRRFSYMLNTLEVIDRVDSYVESADSANAGELPEGWTGADFGELPPEDFGEQPGNEREWTGADFGELPPEDFAEQSGNEREWTGRDFGELPPEDFGEQAGDEHEWTGADFGELPPEDFGEQAGDEHEWTGRDFGELPAEDFFTGADYGELSPEELGG